MFKILPRYLTETVKGIAATMNIDAAPILADALQDDGCEDWDMLRRLRHESYGEYKRDVFVQLSRAYRLVDEDDRQDNPREEVLILG